MPATKSPKPPLSPKSMAGQILFAVALLILARLLWTHAQPEHLIPMENRTLKVSGDHVYLLGRAIPALQERPNCAIDVQSIYDPARTMLVPDDQNSKFCMQDTAEIADGNLYYALEPFSRYFYAPPRPIPSPRSLGTYLLQPTSAGQTRTSALPQPNSDLQTRFSRYARVVRFLRLPLKGGAPQEVMTLQVEEFRLIGSHLFWVRPATEESVAVTQGRKSWLETTAHSDLMLTSLADGTTRCIRHGISRYTYLSLGKTQMITDRIVGVEGVSWKELAPFPGPTPVYYARASDGIVHSLQLSEGQLLTLLPEFEGRLYWTVTPIGLGPYAHDVLMSSNRGGADIRQVLAEADHRPISNLVLYPYHGALYCLLDEPPLLPLERTQSFLCRLHPDQPRPIEILRKIPALSSALQFNGGYLYFGWLERHRGPWATLTDDDVNDTWTSTLSRIPLGG